MSTPDEYVVMARRYRPRAFGELVGQEHVAEALSGAINSHRVGHAYLFTGARGVGKTSTARILAKALNCEQGPTPSPCHECDSCQRIAAGTDIDVLEIDGASNRGIDEIRELRQNVGVRPSRSRFKIYIIDEVHMLTQQAFNALLKTLEEPPEHVKFIFCTTEADKIPITVLSRCQRFDFAGIRTASIAERLGQIARAEGIEAEPEALQILARRAAGSMRDSQSLLEQLLACVQSRLVVADVHRLLGTADGGRLSRIAEHLVARHAAGALAELDSALAEGVDLGQLADQLVGYFRDLMVCAAGCKPDAFLTVSPAEGATAVQIAGQLGLETTMAAMQILDQTMARLRYSTQGRVLLELALVRICNLTNLQDLSQLIGQMQAGQLGSVQAAPNAARAGTSTDVSHREMAANVQKKKPEPAESPARPPTVPAERPIPGSSSKPTSLQAPEPATEPTRGRDDAADQRRDVSPQPAHSSVSQGESIGVPAAVATSSGVGLTSENVQSIWKQVLTQLSEMLAAYAERCESVAISAPNVLVVTYREKYTSSKLFCERPEQLAKLKQALRDAVGESVEVRLEIVPDPPGSLDATKEPKRRVSTANERLLEKSQHRLVKRVLELFDARPTGVEEPGEPQD